MSDNGWIAKQIEDVKEDISTILNEIMEENRRHDSILFALVNKLAANTGSLSAIQDMVFRLEVKEE